MHGPLKKADEKIETESAGDSFEANDERSEEGSLEAAKQNLHQGSESSGNHLSVKSSKKGSKSKLPVSSSIEKPNVTGNQNESMGASELD